MNAPSGARRLAIVLSHPTQYYSPWFRWLGAHTALEFRVFYLWDAGVTERRDPEFGATFRWDVDLLSGYSSEFVPNRSRNPGAESFRGFDNPDLPARLDSWRPGALLLFGYKWAGHLRAAWWARRRGVPVLFRGDSHFLGRSPGLRHRIPLRILYGGFKAFLCVGAANRDYYAALGVPPSRLFMAPHAVDSELFSPADPRHRAAAADLRSRLGLAPATTVVLCAGKLTPGKQPRELLEAYLALAPRNTALVYVGDGPEKTVLEAAAAASGAAVRFLPFANQSQMPARLLLGDVFALPSRAESWGLAVNEAMHMGLPCLVGDRTGCQRDLVTDGETGWVFRVGDPGSLKAKLAEALAAFSDPAARERMRAAVGARIALHTYRQTTAGLMEALASLA